MHTLGHACLDRLHHLPAQLIEPCLKFEFTGLGDAAKMSFGFGLGNQNLAFLGHVQALGGITQDGVFLPLGLVVEFLRQFFGTCHDGAFERDQLALSVLTHAFSPSIPRSERM